MAHLSCGNSLNPRNSAVNTLDQALRDAEDTAEAARRSAMRVASLAKAVAKAAQTGNIAALKRNQENLEHAVETLRTDASQAVGCWSLTDEDEQRVFEEEYADALKNAAAAAGLAMFERDGLLISYPSIIRLLPAERAVRIDRKKVSTIKPSYLVDLLLRQQKKSSGFSPQRLLEALYFVYREVLKDLSGKAVRVESGRVVPLSRIYGLMTALPGVSREYDRNDFARDIYTLDSLGPRNTRNGATVSFPSSTGTRRRSKDLFSFVGQDGESAEYYGIRFTESGA